MTASTTNQIQRSQVTPSNRISAQTQPAPAIHTNRIADITPLASPTQTTPLPPSQLSPEFDKMARTFYRQLPLIALLLASLGEIFQAYNASKKKIMELVQQLHDLFRITVWSSFELRSDDPQQHKKMVDALWAKFSPQIPLTPLTFPRELDWNLAARPAAEAYDHLALSTWKTVVNVFANFHADCTTAQERGLLGDVQYHPDNPKVACYTYFKGVAIHQTKAHVSKSMSHKQHHSTNAANGTWNIVTENWQRTTTARNHELTLRSAKHQHEVFDVDHLSLPATDLPQPHKVRQLLQHIPSICLSAFQFLVGDIVRETVIEKDLDIRRWDETEHEDQLLSKTVVEGRIVDPALTLGNFVFVGWSDRDL